MLFYSVILRGALSYNTEILLLLDNNIQIYLMTLMTTSIYEETVCSYLT